MNIKKVRCLIPFTVVQFGNFGMVRTCCNKWNDLGPVGNLYSCNDFRSIWNSPKIQYLRRAVITDTVAEVCNPDICPYLLKDEYIYLDDIENKNSNLIQIVRQVIDGKTELSTLPLTLNLANEGTCNLRCILCSTNGVVNKPGATLQKKILDSILPMLVPHLSTMIIAGNGEPFIRKDTWKILTDKKIQKINPDLMIDMITNGTLFNSHTWEKISHHRFMSVSVSIDAATKKTYEAVRKGGTWEILKENLSLISRLRKQNILPFFKVSFLVMKCNYTEMIDFVKMGLELSCDEIIFQRPLGYVNSYENYLLSRDVSTMVKIGKILEDPIFLNPQVNIDRVAFMKNMAMKKVSFLDVCISHIIRYLLYIPLKCILFTRKLLTPLIIIIIASISRSKESR